MVARKHLFILLILSFYAFKVHAQTATKPNGSGTEADPYLIASLENLYWLTQSDSVWDKHFLQTADINASDSRNWDGGKGYSPIGENYPTKFSGFYDGGFYTIDSLYINRPDSDYMGFIGYSTNTSTLKNLKLTNANIINRNDSGIALGYSSGTVENIYTSGEIKGEERIGGVIGYVSEGTINNCQSTAYVQAIDELGGVFAGQIYDASVSNIIVVGIASGTYYMGGFAGEIESSRSIVQNVFSSSIVTHSPYNGSFAAIRNSSATLSNAYYDAQLDTVDNGNGTPLTAAQLRDSTFFTGFDFDSVWTIQQDTSYPYLQNLIPEKIPGTQPRVFTPFMNSIGNQTQLSIEWTAIPNTISYDLQISTNNDFSSIDISQSGITGTSYTLTSPLTLHTDYFVRIRSNYGGSTGAWGNVIKFKTTAFNSGSGTPSDPFEITNLDQIEGILESLDADYVLTTNLDFSEKWSTGTGFTPIGTSFSPFSGSIDGNGHTIENLMINLPDQNEVGFIGYGSDSSVVKNIHFKDVDISGKYYVGAVAGRFKGNLSNITISGDLSSIQGMLGGLVGEATGLNHIDSIAVNVNVSSTGDRIGGIVGHSLKGISNSYATGTIVGNNNVGGLAGSTRGSISNSYSIANIQGNMYVGGISGYAENQNESYNDIYSTGTVSATTNAGGIFGVLRGTLSNVYTTSTVSATSSYGGLIGGTSSTYSISNAYFNEDNAPDNSFGTALTSSEIRNASSYNGFNFSATWTLIDGLTSPYLIDLVPDSLPNYSYTEMEGQSLNFNNGRVEIPNDSAFTDLEALTLEAWIKTDTLARQGIIEKFSSSSGFWLRVESSGQINSMVQGSSSSLSNLTSTVSGSIQTGEWYHIALVYDGTDVNLFINGVDATHSVTKRSSGSVQNNTANIGIGDLSWTSASFNGQIDEVRIWNVARGESELKDHMYQKLNGNETGLIAYIPADNANGSLLTNLADESNNATMDSGVSLSQETHPYGTFITGNEGWRIMSNPVKGKSYNEILAPIWTQGFTGADYTGGSSNVYTYDENTKNFEALTDGNTIPEAGQGYIVYVYEDDDNDGFADDFPKRIIADTTQFAGVYTPNLSYTSSGNDAEDGWNLIGNPYGSTIDWDSPNGLSISNLDQSIYVWSDTANGGSGAYLSWNGTTGTLGDGLIAPWQGFWVKTNNDSASLHINDLARSAGATLLKKKPTPEIRLQLKQNNSQLKSEAIISFNEQASFEKDVLDAYKLQSLNNEFISIATSIPNGNLLEINSIPLNHERIQIPIVYDASSEQANLSLSWELKAIPDEWSIRIIDSKSGVEYDIHEHKDVEFVWFANSKVRSNIDEFTAPSQLLMKPKVLKSKTASTEAPYYLVIETSQAVDTEEKVSIPNQVELQQNYPNPFNPSTTIAYGVPQSGKVTLEVFDVIGRKVATLINGETKSAGRYTVHFDARNLASGMYIYRLQMGATVLSKKFTLIK